MLHAKTLHDLEFPRILGLLAAETTTPPGADLALAVRPSPEPAVVQRENNLTGEAVRYLAQHGALPFGTIIDPLPMLDRLDLDGSLLDPQEIVEMLGVMQSGRAIKSDLTSARQAFPALWEPRPTLPDLGNLVRQDPRVRMFDLDHGQRVPVALDVDRFENRQDASNIRGRLRQDHGVGGSVRDHRRVLQKAP